MTSPVTPTLNDASAVDPVRGRGGGRSNKKSAPSSIMDRERRKLLIPLVGPAFVFYTVLFIIPSLAAIWISFHKWAGAGPMEFVGFKNYVRIAGDELFRHSFVNTLKLLFVVGIIIFVVAFALTLVLRDMWGKGAVRSIIFFPHLVNALVYGALAGFIFNPNGLVNKILEVFGIDAPPAWLATDNIFMLIMATLVLTMTGYYTTILMAGVDRIPPSLFEDCALAGANAWQRLRYVILPLTWDVFGTCAVLWTITSVKIFEVVWLFGGAATEGGPPIQTWTVAVYTFVTAFGGTSIPAYGMASAASIISLLLVLVLVVLLRRLMRREALEF
ncbi:MAG: sugar ABC transporter permease [Propionibacteriaceae bacterium]|nr:sugar ABC transporter permease [Propionibacteriaceae bacterium]